MATTPRSFPKDAAATATAKEGEGVPSSRSERGGTDPDSAAEGGSSIIRPAFSEGEENGAVQVRETVFFFLSFFFCVWTVLFFLRFFFFFAYRTLIKGVLWVYKGFALVVYA